MASGHLHCGGDHHAREGRRNPCARTPDAISRHTPHTPPEAHPRRAVAWQGAVQSAVNPSPRAIIISLEDAVCKDSCTWGLPVLLSYSSVRILADSVLQRENIRAWATSRSCSACGRSSVAPIMKVWVPAWSRTQTRDTSSRVTTAAGVLNWSLGPRTAAGGPGHANPTCVDAGQCGQPVDHSDRVPGVQPQHRQQPQLGLTKGLMGG